MRRSICACIANLLAIWLATLITPLFASPTPKVTTSPPGNLRWPDWNGPNQGGQQIESQPWMHADQREYTSDGTTCWGQAESGAAESGAAESGAADATIVDCKEAISLVLRKFHNPTDPMFDQLPWTPWIGGDQWQYFNEGATVGSCFVTFDVEQSDSVQLQSPLPARPYTPDNVMQGLGLMIITCMVDNAMLFGQKLFKLKDNQTLRVMVQRTRTPQDANLDDSGLTV